MTKNRFPHIILSLVLLATAIVPRVLHLDQFVTADENRWFANVAGFTTKLSKGDIGHLLQQPHPGITTQWFAAPAVWSNTWALKKLPLVLAQCILLLFAGYLMARLWGKRAGYIGFGLLAINPFLIAHTRVYAMDSLLAIFSLLAILSFLVWNKETSRRYLMYAGAACALAFLSKLPGIVLVPYLVCCIIFLKRNLGWREILNMIGIFLLSFIVASCIVLPSFFIRPIGVLNDMGEFFRSGDYTVLHQYGPKYYLQTIFFLSTPIQVVALLFGTLYKRSIRNKKDIAILLLFAALFIIVMTLGAKKGDRYILPAFLMFDASAAYVLGQLTKAKKSLAVLSTSLLSTVYVLAILIQLHPYELAYVNPLTKPFIGNRQLGWGEGLDFAINYLNAKPDAKDLKVAMYYASQFENRFQGNVVPAHEWDSGNVDYVVLYRAMYGRGPDAWETDVLHHFSSQIPEKTFSVGGIPYVWIYKTSH